MERLSRKSIGGARRRLKSSRRIFSVLSSYGTQIPCDGWLVFDLDVIDVGLRLDQRGAALRFEAGRRRKSTTGGEPAGGWASGARAWPQTVTDGQGGICPAGGPAPGWPEPAPRRLRRRRS